MKYADKQPFYLLGQKLSHSYSQDIHRYFGYDYSLKEINPPDLKAFITGRKYGGLNITIPYKKSVIPFLDKLDSTAAAIGSVNTIKNDNGTLVGYNTDIYGISYLFARCNIECKGKNAIVLGTGGASNTASYYLKNKGAADIKNIGRKTLPYNYDNLSSLYSADIIINATPVGMYPDNGVKPPINLSNFKNLCFVADLIYNPFTTELMFDAIENGIASSNGLYMLVAQAKKARDIFLSEVTDDGIIEDIANNIISRKQNIVLIGMPASGKTTVGKKLSIIYNKRFVDTDEEIKRIYCKSAAEIIESDGEDYFRRAESKILENLGKENGLIIATGGGAVTCGNAYRALKQNGTVIYLKRNFSNAATFLRPLSSSEEKYRALENSRIPIYNKFADIIIDNNGELSAAIQKISEALK